MFYNKITKIICVLFLIINMCDIAKAETTYSKNEIIEQSDNFFGQRSGDLARVFAKIFNIYGKPNAYILGLETSASFIGGITYGKGEIYNKTGKLDKVFWTGPSLGADVGGQASRLMILVYNLNNIEELWHRYPSVSGSAYLLAGAGFNVLQRDNIL